jgi:hypothetical protein
MKFTLFGALALTACVLAPPQRAEASLTGCAAITLAKVENATACLFDTGFTNDSEAVVNRLPGAAAGYFGHKDWVMVDRDENNGALRGYAFDPDEIGGGEMMMLVFKSGSINQSPSLIAYLVNSTAGEWETPFTRNPFPNHPVNGRAVSHISYYTRLGEVPPPFDAAPTSGVAVPLPAALARFGIGLAGLAFTRRMSAPQARSLKGSPPAA